MHSTLKAIVQFLKSENLPFAKANGSGSIHLKFEGGHFLWNTQVEMAQDQPVVFFHSILPAKASAELRQACLVHLNQLNENLLGHFLMDESDGIIVFRISQVIASEASVDQIMRWVIPTILHAMSTKGWQLIKFLTAENINPLDASVPNLSEGRFDLN